MDIGKKPKRQRASKKASESCILIQRAARMFFAVKEKQKRKRLFAKKTNIANELLQTERLYASNITILHKTFLEPLVQSAEDIFVTEPELLNSLNQLASILKVMIGYHNILLERLEIAVEKSWGVNTKLGKIFSEMSSYLKSYTQYVTHYQPTLRMLKNNRGNERLTCLLGDLKTNECKGKGMKDFLIMPIQRIPRYNMMLTDLVQKTWPGHCDFVDLLEASAQIKEICGHVEFMSEKASKLEKKMEIVQKVHIPRKRKWGFSLTAPHCYFMWEDNCKVHIVSSLKEVQEISISAAHIFTFSDVILICELRKDKFRARAYILLDEVKYMQKMMVNGEECCLACLRSAEIKMSPNEDTNKDFFKNLELFSKSREEEDQISEELLGKLHNSGDRRTVRIRRSLGNNSGGSDSASRRLSRNMSLKNIKSAFAPQNSVPRRNSSATAKPKLSRRASLAKITRSLLA